MTTMTHARLKARLTSVSSLLVSLVVTMFGLLVLIFIIGRIIPVDPVLAIIGNEANQDVYDKVYHQLGFDQPVYMQFLRYVSDILHGDLGTSILTGRPIADDIIRVFPATMELSTLAILFATIVGIPLGVYAAVKRDTLVDHTIRLVSLLGYSTPVFWLGLMGLLVFYANLGWSGGTGRVAIYFKGMTPTTTGFILIDSLIEGQWDVFKSAVSNIWLPASILGVSSMAYVSRMTRSFMLEQLNQEYIVAARVKGLSASKVIWRHAFRNILVQLVTIIALTYGALLEGAVLIETVYSWPGFGSYLTSSLLIGDMNGVMACVLLIGLIFVILNLISDILYRVFDPRTR